MVEGKINDWFDHRRAFDHYVVRMIAFDHSDPGPEYRLYKWLKTEMVVGELRTDSD